MGEIYRFAGNLLVLSIIQAVAIDGVGSEYAGHGLGAMSCHIFPGDSKNRSVRACFAAGRPVAGVQ